MTLPLWAIQQFGRGPDRCDFYRAGLFLHRLYGADAPTRHDWNGIVSFSGLLNSSTRVALLDRYQSIRQYHRPMDSPLQVWLNRNHGFRAPFGSLR